MPHALLHTLRFSYYVKLYYKIDETESHRKNGELMELSIECARARIRTLQKSHPSIARRRLFNREIQVSTH